PVGVVAEEVHGPAADQALQVQRRELNLQTRHARLQLIFQRVEVAFRQINLLQHRVSDLAQIEQIVQRAVEQRQFRVQLAADLRGQRQIAVEAEQALFQ